jgi:hypothetical protein
MKTYLVEIMSRYLDGTSESEIISVRAYSLEHAEERAFELCGGSAGHCHGMTFRARKAK